MKNLIAAILSLMLGACASLTSGTQQTVTIDTPMIVGAACKLTDSKNARWYLPSAPGSVTVQKGDGPMHVVCEKEGYQSSAISVNEEMEGAVLGNILIGGIIGVVIDASNGAAQKYPDNITVWMKPTEWKSPDDEVAWNTAKQAYDTSKAGSKKGINPALLEPPSPWSQPQAPAQASVGATGQPVAMAATGQQPASNVPIYTKETVPPGGSYLGPDGRWVHTVADKGDLSRKLDVERAARAAAPSAPDQPQSTLPLYTKETVPPGGSYLGPDGRWVHTVSNKGGGFR